jgi:hypothetical protein
VSGATELRALGVLQKCEELVQHANSTAQQRVEAVRAAYEIGQAPVRLEMAEEMCGKRLRAS